MHLFTMVASFYDATPQRFPLGIPINIARKTAINISSLGKRGKASLEPVTGRFANVPFVNVLYYLGAPNENIVQNHFNIAFLNAF